MGCPPVRPQRSRGVPFSDNGVHLLQPHAGERRLGAIPYTVDRGAGNHGDKGE